MRSSRVSSAFFFILLALVYGTHNLDYSDLEALDLACPERNSCSGYRNNRSYLDRSCECDSACDKYHDCCINAKRRNADGPSAQSAAGNDMVCMHYGANPNAGVYVIAHCDSNWKGSEQVREKCEGQEDDFSDPLVAAPVTSVPQAVTYRNRYCAECNNAGLLSLTLFTFNIECHGLQDIPVDQQLADLTYNRKLNMWGVNRPNSFDNGSLFYGCDITFDVPSYLNSSVRFCRSEMISSCPETWTRQSVRRACEEYMSVVFSSQTSYRNPHCAICNGERVDQLSCTTYDISRKRPRSPAITFDINRRGGDEVGMINVRTSKCAVNQKYDPFFKKCRNLLCALRDRMNGRCVKS